MSSGESNFAPGKSSQEMSVESKFSFFSVQPPENQPAVKTFAVAELNPRAFLGAQIADYSGTTFEPPTENPCYIEENEGEQEVELQGGTSSNVVWSNPVSSPKRRSPALSASSTEKVTDRVTDRVAENSVSGADVSASLMEQLLKASEVPTERLPPADRSETIDRTSFGPPTEQFNSNQDEGQSRGCLLGCHNFLSRTLWLKALVVRINLLLVILQYVAILLDSAGLYALWTKNTERALSLSRTFTWVLTISGICLFFELNYWCLLYLPHLLMPVAATSTRQSSIFSDATGSQMQQQTQIQQQRTAQYFFGCFALASEIIASLDFWILIFSVIELVKHAINTNGHLFNPTGLPPTAFFFLRHIFLYSAYSVIFGKYFNRAIQDYDYAKVERMIAASQQAELRVMAAKSTYDGTTCSLGGGEGVSSSPITSGGNSTAATRNDRLAQQQKSRIGSFQRNATALLLMEPPPNCEHLAVSTTGTYDESSQSQCNTINEASEDAMHIGAINGGAIYKELAP